MKLLVTIQEHTPDDSAAQGWESLIICWLPATAKGEYGSILQEPHALSKQAMSLEAQVDLGDILRRLVLRLKERARDIMEPMGPDRFGSISSPLPLLSRVGLRDSSC